jgi:hypothetical protein
MTTSRRSSGESTRERSAPDGTKLLALELQQIRSAESELSHTLPSLAEAVESEELRELLELRVKQGKRLLGEVEARGSTFARSKRDRRSMRPSSPASRRSSTTASQPGAPPGHWPRPPATRPPCALWSRS